MAMNVLENGIVQEVPARLSLFHIGDDGKLNFRRSYDVDVGGKFMWWMGMMGLN